MADGFREDVTVKLKLLRKDAQIPCYQHDGDAGFDFVVVEDVDLYPGQTKFVHTGLAMDIPLGYEVQIRLRSGVAKEGKLIIPNAPATVDSGYTGEIKTLVTNMSDHMITVKKGTSISQGVLNRVPRAIFEVTCELPVTDRGDGGFGSTGMER